MEWKTTAPEEPGEYWTMSTRGTMAIRRVYDGAYGLCIATPAFGIQGRLKDTPVSMVPLLWYGPLERPAAPSFTVKWVYRCCQCGAPGNPNESRYCDCGGIIRRKAVKE